MVTYHPMLKSLGKILHNNIHLLYMNEEVRRTFTAGPMISLVIWLGPNYTLEKNCRMKKCGKERCEVCENIDNSDNFTGSVTGEDYKIIMID